MTIRVVAIDGLPEDSGLLISAPMSEAGADEFNRRVDAGEDRATVYVEILLRERKIVRLTFTP